MIIHQIFLKVSDKNFEDFPCYEESSNKWKSLCDKYGWEYKLHTEVDQNIMTDEEKEIMKLGTERYPFFPVDYYRYIFLCKYGGMYVDLDVISTDNFEKIKDDDIIVGRTSTRENIKYENNNNIIKLTPELNLKLKNFCNQQFYEKCEINIYHTWKKRFLLRTVGAQMFSKFCKLNKIKFNDNFDDYFIDVATGTWSEF